MRIWIRHEGWQPVLRIRPKLLNQGVEALDGVCPSGNHGEFALKTFEVQLAHHTVVSLSHQELPRADGQLLLDQSKLPFGQPEALDILGMRAFRIREENLGRRLLDESPADGRRQYITDALSRQAHHAVEFAPGSRPVSRETLKCLIRQQPPEFIHPAHQAAPIEHPAYQVKQVQRQWRPDRLLIEEIRDIKTD